MGELVHGLVEALHPVAFAGLDDLGELAELVVLDGFFHGAGVDHDFLRGRHAAINGGTHALADDGFEGAGELAADGVAFVLFEKFQDAADRAGRAGGVHRGHNHRAGVGGADGGLEADGVAHFADHDDVGILAQGALHAALEAHGVERKFALLDDALVFLEDEFDGVFEGDDVFAVVGINVLKHRGERGGFAGAGGAGEQDDAAGGFGDGAEDVRQAELFHAGDGVLDEAQDDAPAAEGLEDVGTEATDAGAQVGVVGLAIGIEAGPQVLRGDAINEFRHPSLIRNELAGVQAPADAKGDGAVGLDVDVGGAALGGSLQDFVKIANGVRHARETSGGVGRCKGERGEGRSSKTQSSKLKAQGNGQAPNAADGDRRSVVVAARRGSFSSRRRLARRHCVLGISLEL